MFHNHFFQAIVKAYCKLCHLFFKNTSGADVAFFYLIFIYQIPVCMCKYSKMITCYINARIHYGGKIDIFLTFYYFLQFDQGFHMLFSVLKFEIFHCICSIFIINDAGFIFFSLHISYIHFSWHECTVRMYLHLKCN